MSESVFSKCDFLLPAEAELVKWSTIACDQFSSEPEYWAQAEEIIGDSPSTLHLMLPEVRLPYCDSEAETLKIKQNMRDYLDNGIFKVVEDSFIYVERLLSSGSIRRGLIGTLDLENYEYLKTSTTLIRATEEAVPDRLPPRVMGRQGAPLDLPHIVVFIDDPEHTVIDPIIYAQEKPEMLYDFDLMLGGGHITGWRVCGNNAKDVECALERLGDPEVLMEKYNIPGMSPVTFAVGDGNHSLASARICWGKIRETLSPAERLTHPARYSMVELVNIHDSSIIFEPIHRIIFSTDTTHIFDEVRSRFAGLTGDSGKSYDVEFCTHERSEKFTVDGLNIAELIAICEELAQEYMRNFGGRIDYVHDNTAAQLGAQEGNIGILLPAMQKTELFPAIIRSGAFPRKSFSIGYAKDKRYYLECRKISL